MTDIVAFEETFKPKHILRRTRVRRGPVVDVYKYALDASCNLGRLVTHGARHGLRVSVAHGVADIAVDVPREVRLSINMSDLLASAAMTSSRAQIPVALGVDRTGHPMIGDLRTMGHILVAGGVGTGKSMLLKSLVASVVAHFQPATARLVIIDTKGVDFASADRISHLARPVSTAPDSALADMAWLNTELESRYRLLASSGAKSIAGYNKTGAAPMPYIIVVIDELSDLMAVSRRRTERCLCNLAQRGSRVGIHVIASTNRPDSKTLSGMIKACFHTRIAFHAPNANTSRQMLGEPGAELLLPYGDALLSIAGAAPRRIHTPYADKKQLI